MTGALALPPDRLRDVLDHVRGKPDEALWRVWTFCSAARDYARTGRPDIARLVTFQMIGLDLADAGPLRPRLDAMIGREAVRILQAAGGGTTALRLVTGGAA